MQLLLHVRKIRGISIILENLSGFSVLVKRVFFVVVHEQFKGQRCKKDREM